MADDIPIKFTCQDKEYNGFLSEVMGAGSSATFHLYIDKFYCGRLRMAKGEWVFDPTPKTESFADVADYFGNYIMLWLG